MQLARETEDEQAWQEPDKLPWQRDQEKASAGESAG